MRSWVFFLLGGLFGLVGVAAGAFGGHLLKERLAPAMVDVFETGVRYQMYHALALLIVGWAAHQWRLPWFRRAGWMFTIGVLLFSGSLYALSLTEIRWFGAFTPLGGTAFILGWGFLAWGGWQIRHTGDLLPGAEKD